MRLIGREYEKETLLNAYDSEKSEFVAIYGRRRIGKTFLVRETFNNNFSFYYSGRDNVSPKIQLKFFEVSLKEQGLFDCPKLNDWIEAFSELKRLLDQNTKKRKIIFIDEIAWIDNSKSEFLSAFEGFWNEWASARKDILLIICASATSWIINKVFRNRGGLSNRVTVKIRLDQFSLEECEEYSDERNLGYSRMQILDLYMVFGGVAYYWTLIEKGLSPSQNIDKLILAPYAPLRSEFSELYYSLFKNPSPYIKIISALGKKTIGMSRKEISDECNLSNSAALGTMLEELLECGLIYRYLPLGKRNNGVIYKVVDCYSLFYMTFVEKMLPSDNWSSFQLQQRYKIWAGLSYERVCFLHLEQIKKKLGISGIRANAYCWFSDRKKLKYDQKGAQIDLLIDRADNLINIVEVKWSEKGSQFFITKELAENLLNKKDVLISQTKTKKGVIFTLVTISEYKNNANSDIIQSSVSLDDLFCKL